MDNSLSIQQKVSPLDELNSKYDKLSQAGELLGKVREGLDGLVKMADTVTAEDVIKVAGRLVAGGLAPKSMAAMLADMPETSEQLQKWIVGQDQQVTQREQQLAQVTSQIRHKLGSTALGMIAGTMPAGAPDDQQPQSMANDGAGEANPLAMGGSNA